jgi:hypothetical protein
LKANYSTTLWLLWVDFEQSKAEKNNKKMENLTKKERPFASFVLIKNVKDLVGGWLVVRAKLLSELLLFSFSIFSLHLQTDASLFFPSAPIRKRSQDARCEKTDRKGYIMDAYIL